jgi:two-component sensor histidine kinase
MLAVTELASNGISHSASGQGGSFTVRLRLAPSWARIEVTDDGPAVGDPSPRNGWELAIVAGVTDRASAATQRDGCRTAWCEVSWPSPEPDDQLGRLSESLTAEHGPVSRDHLAEARAAWPDADWP